MKKVHGFCIEIMVLGMRRISLLKMNILYFKNIPKGKLLQNNQYRFPQSKGIFCILFINVWCGIGN